jgi:hypothetical protein
LKLKWLRNEIWDDLMINVVVEFDEVVEVAERPVEDG